MACNMKEILALNSDGESSNFFVKYCNGVHHNVLGQPDTVSLVAQRIAIRRVKRIAWPWHSQIDCFFAGCFTSILNNQLVCSPAPPFPPDPTELFSLQPSDGTNLQPVCSPALPIPPGTVFFFHYSSAAATTCNLRAHLH